VEQEGGKPGLFQARVRTEKEPHATEEPSSATLFNAVTVRDSATGYK